MFAVLLGPSYHPLWTLNIWPLMSCSGHCLLQLFFSSTCTILISAYVLHVSVCAIAFLLLLISPHYGDPLALFQYAGDQE